jgi:hypothetical protein
MTRKWKTTASALGLLLPLVLAHQFEPEATDLLIAILVVVFAWHVIDWKLMSRRRRAALVARFKERHGVPQDQPHKVDSFLRK